VEYNAKEKEAITRDLKSILTKNEQITKENEKRKNPRISENIEEENWIKQEEQIREEEFKKALDMKYDKERAIRDEMEYEKSVAQKKQAEELTNNGHKRVLLERDRKIQNLNEIGADFKIIDSVDTLKRKEIISKGI
jgi:hypothetical protein